MGSERKISRSAEDKLTYKLGIVAERRCAVLIEAYNECARGRTVSVLWACKRLHTESQRCIAHYVTDPNVQTMADRWLAAGRPKYPDFDALMAGLVDDDYPGVAGGGAGGGAGAGGAGAGADGGGAGGAGGKGG